MATRPLAKNRREEMKLAKLNIQQVLGPRAPRLVLCRVDELFPAVKESSGQKINWLQNSRPCCREKPYLCRICRVPLYCLIALKHHVIDVHLPEFMPGKKKRRIYKCEICGEPFDCPRAVKRHVINHCRICNKSRCRQPIRRIVG
ncbi:hypothetical protein C0J52_12585 [Blattella germanica]|nr:hypothetical protein C0J52_12585 [Blattella germanica]